MFSLEKVQLASHLLISAMASRLSAFQLILIHDIKVRVPPNVKIFFTDFYKPRYFQVREAGWVAIWSVDYTAVAKEPTWNLRSYVYLLSPRVIHFTPISCPTTVLQRQAMGLKGKCTNSGRSAQTSTSTLAEQLSTGSRQGVSANIPWNSPCFPTTALPSLPVSLGNKSGQVSSAIFHG